MVLFCDGGARRPPPFRYNSLPMVFWYWPLSFLLHPVCSSLSPPLLLTLTLSLHLYVEQCSSLPPLFYTIYQEGIFTQPNDPVLTFHQMKTVLFLLLLLIAVLFNTKPGNNPDIIQWRNG